MSMYYTRLKCFATTLVLYGLLLQGCKSGWYVTPEEPSDGKPYKADECEPSNSQAVVPSTSFPTHSNVHFSRPSVDALSASLAVPTSPVAAVPAAQVVPYAHEQVPIPDALSPLRQAALPEELSATKPSACPTFQVAGTSSETCVGALQASKSSVFGAEEWAKYFGEVGEAPFLPDNIAQILHSPCPFWQGQRVKDTHLLVLIPSTVKGGPYTLNLLEALIKSPKCDGHSTQYFLYDDEVQQSLGDYYSSSSYWVLLTRDVLPGSRNKPYAAQKELVAQQCSHVDQPLYEMPHVLEATTAILSHYVGSGDRLYTGGGPDASPSTSTRCEELLLGEDGKKSPITVGGFCTRGLVLLSGFEDDAEPGVSCLRRFGTRNCRSSALFHAFGSEEWGKYLGEVDAEPPLPENIVNTLNSPCPFWPDRCVKDTHLLVLIPSMVRGAPYSLNLLKALIKTPKCEGHGTQYRYYDRDVQKELGDQSPSHSYWILMTRDVLPDSRSQSYAAQKELIAVHARETGLPYVMAGALEVATAVLSYYIQSGDRLYTDNPWTYTRCQEWVGTTRNSGSKYPVIVGGGSIGGLGITYYGNGFHGFRIGVAGLQRL